MMNVVCSILAEKIDCFISNKSHAGLVVCQINFDESETNHVSLTGPEGYRNEGHEGRRKRVACLLIKLCKPLSINVFAFFMQALSSWGISLF